MKSKQKSVEGYSGKAFPTAWEDIDRAFSLPEWNAGKLQQPPCEKGGQAGLWGWWSYIDSPCHPDDIVAYSPC